MPNIILDYIKDPSSCINLSALERKAGLAPRTLHNYINKTAREARTANWWALMKALCPVVIGSHLYCYDYETDDFIVHSFAPANEEPSGKTIERRSPTGGSWFVYYPACYRTLIDDEESFVDWFGTKNAHHTSDVSSAE